MSQLECECGFTVPNDANQGIGIFYSHQKSCRYHIGEEYRKQDAQAQIDYWEKP